jgi:hypothetical protein
MKLSKVTKLVLTMVFFFSMSSAFAQLPEDPDDDVDPVDGPLDPAPINDYLIPMLVLGAATAFILVKKKMPARL